MFACIEMLFMSLLKTPCGVSPPPPNLELCDSRPGSFTRALEIIWILGPKSMPEGSKWRSGRALWDPRVMLRKRERNMRSRGLTFGSFFHDFGCFFGDQIWWKIMFFHNLDFFITNHEFSRDALTLQRFHGFWEIRVDLGGPQNRQKLKKVLPGAS